MIKRMESPYNVAVIVNNVAGIAIRQEGLVVQDYIQTNRKCKEIYYKASRIDKRIGTATVYHMINTLEQMGAISRKNMYKISCGKECDIDNVCLVELSDHTLFPLSARKWNTVIKEGVKACGYIENQEIRSVVLNQMN